MEERIINVIFFIFELLNSIGMILCGVTLGLWKLDSNNIYQQICWLLLLVVLGLLNMFVMWIWFHTPKEKK